MRSRSFALQTSSGKIYQLDSTGNAKAADAMKSRADRSANGAGSTTATSITATVTGKRAGNTIEVENINVQ